MRSAGVAPWAPCLLVALLLAAGLACEPAAEPVPEPPRTADPPVSPRVETVAAPEGDPREARDRVRVADLQRIRGALEAYIADRGRLPRPPAYGEGSSARGFFDGAWDVSNVDADGDGNYFLDFLVESGLLPEVPLDPSNEPRDVDEGVRQGRHYAYFVSWKRSGHHGGHCEEARDRSIYLLAATDLESEDARPPRRFHDSGCACLWQDKPDFFQSHFDYVLCGSF